MKALLSICLFWGLLSPGAPLMCYHCGGEDCAEPENQTCEAHEGACITAVTETTLINGLISNFQLINRNCIPADLCLLNYVSISTLNGGKLRADVQCCYTDLCNDKPISLPEPEESSPNGVQCLGCFVLNSTQCEKDETVECAGEETKCIEGAAHFSVDFVQGELDVYFKGCATPNTCFVPLPQSNRHADKLNFGVTKRQCIQEFSGETRESKSSSESTIPGQGAGSWEPRD